VQLPATQLVDPFAFVQTVPQLPHAFRLIVRSASQPLLAMLSQSPEIPGTQFGVHSPSEHAVVPEEVVHSRSQSPQLVRSLTVAVSQPLSGKPSQFAWPISQLI
jgi:hypothetical protein